MSLLPIGLNPNIAAMPYTDSLRDTSTLGRYVWLCLLGLALGWFEGAVVVYLRELYYPDGFRFPVIIMPAWLVGVELVREAASLLLLAAGARLAGRDFLERFGAFMTLFGIWDLVYYCVLKLVLDWRESFATWDLLFPVAGPLGRSGLGAVPDLGRVGDGGELLVLDRGSTAGLPRV